MPLKRTPVRAQERAHPQAAQDAKGVSFKLWNTKQVESNMAPLVGGKSAKGFSKSNAFAMPVKGKHTIVLNTDKATAKARLADMKKFKGHTQDMSVRGTLLHEIGHVHHARKYRASYDYFARGKTRTQTHKQISKLMRPDKGRPTYAEFSASEMYAEHYAAKMLGKPGVSTNPLIRQYIDAMEQTDVSAIKQKMGALSRKVSAMAKRGELP
jgi:hypothetical protein